MMSYSLSSRSSDSDSSAPPLHLSWDRSPSSSPRSHRGGSRPIFVMNTLLFIGLNLQIYHIYQTSMQPVTSPFSIPTKASFYNDFPRGLRRGLPPIVKEDSLENFVSDRDVTDEFPLRTAWNQHEVPEKSQASSKDFQGWEDADRMRLDHNFMLYGNVNGPDYQWDRDDNANKTTEAPFRYSKYNYSLPAQRTNWTLPTQPKPTNKSNIAVIIMSARSNFDRRQTIRETWAKEHNNVYFIIGGPEPDNNEDKDWSNVNSTSTRLFREQKQYGDILDTVHPDTYKGLPYKVHFTIEWISRHPGMKHIQWVLKADDDVVVRLHALQYYVLRNFNPLAPMVIGRIEPNSKPHRTGKWAEDPAWVGIGDFDQYPPWSYGSTGYVMSRPVVDYVASEGKSLYYYQGEDVSLGIWLYESKLDVSWIHSPDFHLDNEVWSDHKTSAVIGHDLSTEAIQNIFEKWKDPKILKEHFHANHTKVKGVIYETSVRKEYDTNDIYDEFHDYSMYWDGEEGKGENSYMTEEGVDPSFPNSGAPRGYDRVGSPRPGPYQEMSLYDLHLYGLRGNDNREDPQHVLG